jgi:ribose transport system permease protein
VIDNSPKETAKEQQPNMLHGKRRQIPTIYYTIALLLVMGFVFSLGNANFISAYNLTTIASFGAILLMVALGQMCAILIGGIDLSVGGVMSFVSVVFVKVVPTLGYWAYPLCILLGVFIGYVNGNILTRIKIPSFIATLGTGGILMSLAMIVAPVPVNVPADFWGVLDIFNESFLQISNALYISLLVFVSFLS